jgi:hypothetical protein
VFLLACAGVAMLGAATRPAVAQGRELTWPEVTVHARLDADGRLHVRERQVMRFTGVWNGGQRTFAKRHGQEFALEGVTRIDPVTGASRPLVAGDLTDVDEYDWVEGNTLRWRSRLPDDPPFAGTEIVYELEFTYGNILQPRDDGAFLLDHDFAFADREGDFERFELTLDIDSAWRAPAGFRGRYTANDLPPGEGFVVTAAFTRVAASPPAGVRFGADPWMRQALLGGLALGLVALFIRLLRSEDRLGRMAPLPAEEEITREFLQEHVFDHLPEVVGSEWDDQTSAPEVAATLARLVQERKLASTVKAKGAWLFRSHVLHLQLLVPRDRFQPHERALIDALFAAHEDTTDTDRVRERYKKSGFDPASVIRARLEVLANTMTRPHGETPSRTPTLVLVAAAAILLLLGLIDHPADGAVAAVVIACSLPVYFVAGVIAHAWRKRVTALRSGAIGFLIPLVGLTAAFAAILLVGDRFRVGWLVLAGLTMGLLAMANSVFNLARSRQSPGRIARRKRLAAAREYFQAELAKPEPALRDEWFPYVLAFGLGRHIDRWFQAFGGEAASATRAMAHSSGAYAATGGAASGGTWTGFGGGGGFGGAGGGASFASAIGGMAASVPAPSSSSGGGGGGGGGGSSGGGGGGGW